MNRDSKLNPMLIRAQSEFAINNITSCNGELQKVKNSIQAFVDDTSIVSEAFDLLKNYASAIPGTIDKIIENNCKDIEDHRTLAASVGDEVLIGAVIIDSKNRHYKLWWESKEKADMYRSRAQTAVNYSMQSMFQGLANYYNELAQMHHQLYVYWRTKEEKYDRIEGETAGLFNRDNPMINIEDINITNLIRIGGYYVIYKNNVYDFYKKKILEYDEWTYSENYSYIDKDGNVVTNTWNISDEEFTDWRSLTEYEITEICMSYNPELCRDGFDKAIFKACKGVINPKIILATLKQESGGRKSTKNAYGLPIKGIGNKDADTQTIVAVETYMQHYRKAISPNKNGGISDITINKDPNHREIRNFKGDKADEWMKANPQYVEYMEKGISITPVNAAMYAKLKYTPWTDFPPNGAHQLSDWHNIVMEYNSYEPIPEE